MTIQSDLALPSQNLWPSRSGKRLLGMWVDGLFRLLCQAAALLVLVLAVLVTAVLAWKSWLAIRTIGISFLTSMTWDPEPSHRRFGALAFVYGTVATSVIAMVIAVPLGVGTATCLSEVAPGWLRRVCSPLVEMLAAVPSVVYGFWGLFVVAPALQRLITGLGGPNQGGVGILSAGFVLSIMVVPYVATISFDALQAVPRLPAGGGAGPRRHPLADDQVFGASLRLAGHPGRVLYRPGPGAGRDDGRDDAHRQPPRHLTLTVRDGQLDRKRHRERVHRGDL